MIAGYRRTLDIALRHRFITLLVFFATMSLSVYLFITAAEGLLPTAGYRRDHRHHRRRAGYFL